MRRLFGCQYHHHSYRLLQRLRWFWWFRCRYPNSRWFLRPTRFAVNVDIDTTSCRKASSSTLLYQKSSMSPLLCPIPVSNAFTFCVAATPTTGGVEGRTGKSVLLPLLCPMITPVSNVFTFLLRSCYTLHRWFCGRSCNGEIRIITFQMTSSRRRRRVESLTTLACAVLNNKWL